MQYVQDIFSGGEKVFPVGRIPLLRYGPGHYMIRYADITFMGVGRGGQGGFPPGC